MTYAEKLVADLWRANTEMHEKRVSIISAALKRQREACAEAFTEWWVAGELEGAIAHAKGRDAILNAEVEEKE